MSQHLNPYSGRPKRAWPTRGEAFAHVERVSRMHLDGRVEEYRCDECGLWHLGHGRRKENTVNETIVAPEDRVFEGIGYPVALRVTPGCDIDGMPESGSVLWTAEMEIRSGVSLVAWGTTGPEALLALNRRIVEHAEPYPVERSA